MNNEDDRKKGIAKGPFVPLAIPFLFSYYSYHGKCIIFPNYTIVHNILKIKLDNS